MKKKPITQTELRFAVVAVDIALFTLKDGKLHVRLVSADQSLFPTSLHVLPGGIITSKETAEEAVMRHIKTKARIESNLYIEQLYTFSEIDRDPRGRVVSVSYLGLVPWEQLSETEKGESGSACWIPVSKAKKLGYDHDEILTLALDRLRSRLHYTTIISHLLSCEFTLTDLETAYENILNIEIDKRNFRKKILKVAVLNELNKKRGGGPFRPASLYSFSSKEVRIANIL